MIEGGAVWEFIFVFVMTQGCPLACNSLHLACTWTLAETEPHRGSTNRLCATSPLTNSGSPPGPPSARSRCVSRAQLQNSHKNNVIVTRFEGLEVWFSTQKQIWQIIESPYGSRFNLKRKNKSPNCDFISRNCDFIIIAMLYLTILIHNHTK